MKLSTHLFQYKKEKIMEMYKDQITAYINGTLEGMALQDFEVALKNHPELAKEVQLYRDLKMIKENKDFYAIAASLHNFKKKYPVVEPDFDIDPEFLPKKISEKLQIVQSKFFLGLVSLILLVIIGLSIGKYQAYKVNQKRLFIIDTLLHNPNLYVERQLDPPGVKDSLSKGLIFYDHKQYGQALLYLNYKGKYLQSYYLKKIIGISYIIEDQTALGIAELESIRNDDKYSDEGIEWYLALAYLKKGDIVSSKILLDKLKDDAKYGQYVKKLFEELKL